MMRLIPLGRLFQAMRGLGVPHILTVFLSLQAATAVVNPPQPVIPTKVFNVKDYGAIGNGVMIETKAIQESINAATRAGGGVVEIPAGTYLSGPVVLASQINLRLEQGAMVKMLPMKQYPPLTNGALNFISGENLHDVAISGSGTIDGQGADWWPFAKSDKTIKRPIMIKLSKCDRVLIEGVHLQNSPMFHIAVRSENVTVRGVTITAPSSTDPITPSHNTDACDVSGNNILIQDCNVSVGDDNFTCGGHTGNVLITNCTYGTGHGLSIGSYTQGWVSNITVTDCTFNNTEYGIRIKSDRDRGGLVHDLTYNNLRMTNVGTPILIYGSYHAKDKKFRDLKNLTSTDAATYPSNDVTELTPMYQNITFRNITATVEPGHRAGLIFGLPEACVTNVLLQHVDITADKPFGIYYARNVRLEDCKIVTPEGTNKLDVTHAQVEINPH
jgi:polygalacturonase